MRECELACVRWFVFSCRCGCECVCMCVCVGQPLSLSFFLSLSFPLFPLSFVFLTPFVLAHVLLALGDFVLHLAPTTGMFSLRALSLTGAA